MTEEDAERRLLLIHHRLEWIANAEERAAWVKGYSATGVHEAERDKLIEATERILDEMEARQRQ